MRNKKDEISTTTEDELLEVTRELEAQNEELLKVSEKDIEESDEKTELDETDNETSPEEKESEDSDKEDLTIEDSEEEPAKHEKEEIEILEPRQNNLPKKTYYGLKSRLAFLVVPMLILFLLAFIFTKQALNFVDVYQVSYKETSNLDYTVCLLENPYFNERCLEKDKIYISNIIDYINADFQYTFDASVPMEYKYKYSVKSIISAVEKGGKSDKNIYLKEDIILPEKAGTQSGSIFNIKENLKIDYNKYNQLMTGFRKDYALLPVSDLRIILTLELEAQHENLEEPININQELLLTIPLSEQTLNIDMEFQELNNKEIVSIQAKNGYTIYLYYIAIIVSLVGAIILAVRLIKFIRKLHVSQTTSEYTKRLNNDNIHSM